MDAATLFKRRHSRIFIRLMLAQWTQLPPEDSDEWKVLTLHLGIACSEVDAWLEEARHNGCDVFLRLSFKPVSAAMEPLLDALRREVGNPNRNLYLGVQRFVWAGDSEMRSMRWDEKLDSLRDTTRAHKLEHFQRGLGRKLQDPWHDAESPEAVGVEYVRAVIRDSRVNLAFRRPSRQDVESWAAAHLNTRIRLPEHPAFWESEGWDFCEDLTALTFSQPEDLDASPPEQIEVWWFSEQRRLVTTIPCIFEAAENAGRSS